MIGLQKAKRVIEKLTATDSGVHAVLLYGPEGVGKRHLAGILTEHWLGNKRAVDAYRRGTNPDVLNIEPMGASRIIRVGQIVQSEEKFDVPVTPLSVFHRMSPLYSDAKVVVIHDADRMNNAAFNALLKPLEEPQSFGKLILTTRTISQIRPTILSRCLVIACELPNDADLSEAFPQASDQLIKMSGSSPGQLHKMLVHPEFYARVAAFADAIVAAPIGRSLKLSDELRLLADELDGYQKMGARTANATIVELVAAAVAKRYPSRSDLIQELGGAHSRIIGNGAASLVFDALFTKILVK